MSYRHSSYRKVVRAKLAALENPGGTARHHGNRISHWMNARPLDKPEGWGQKRPRHWPEGAACTDCAPDGVCEQGCIDEPRNPKARLRAA